MSISYFIFQQFIFLPSISCHYLFPHIVHHTLSRQGVTMCPICMALLSFIHYPSVYCHCHLRFYLIFFVLISLSPHSLTIGLLVFTFSLSCLVYHTLSITGSDYVPHSMALLSTITYPSVYCHCHLFTFLILFKLIISPIISPAFVTVTSTNYTILFVL